MVSKRVSSSNVNEVIRAVLNVFIFFTKRFYTHQKHQKHLKALQELKAQRCKQANAQNANKRTVNL